MKNMCALEIVFYKKRNRIKLYDRKDLGTGTPHYLTNKRMPWGCKFYEEKNHLGNVMSVTNDRKVPVDDGSGGFSHFKTGILRQSDYYPFGYENPQRSYLSKEYRYGYNGKEQDDEGEFHSVTHYNYGARIYNPAVGRFLTVDPLAEKRSWLSPYNYVQNNPISRVDPTGALDNPIYDREGNLLGTDDRGLQGEAIVMDEKHFTQGMSHEKAMQYNIGTESLSGAASTKFQSSYAGLKNRPDWDGKINIKEANNWYRSGGGDPLFVDLGKLDLSSITPNQFDQNKQINYFNILFRGNIKDGLVYGSIGLTHQGSNKVKGYFDEYDFNMRPWNSGRNNARNILTKIGKLTAGEGSSYRINFYGTGKISSNRNIFSPNNPGIEMLGPKY